MLLQQHWKCPCVYVAPGQKAEQPCQGFTASEPALRRGCGAGAAPRLQAWLGAMQHASAQ